MRRPFFAVILLFTLDFARAQQAVRALRPEHFDTGGVLRQFNIASFGGSGQTTIQALATDSSGDILVAGSTNAPDFPVKNAAQPALGDAAILRTTDLGATWTRVVSPPGGVGTVVPDPIDPQVLFAGTSTGVFKSSDGGQTWLLVYPGASASLVIDPGNHLRLAALGPGGSLIRSLDGGSTWTAGCPPPTCGGQVIANPGVGRLIGDPSGSGALVIVTPFALYLSRDWGQTFSPIGPPRSGTISAAAMVPSHPGWIYGDGGEGTLGILSLSTDYGATWTVKANPPTNFPVIYGLGVDPDQPNVLVAATADGLYKSTNGATSWTRQSGFYIAVPGGQGSLFALVSHQCNPAGGLFAVVSGPGYYQVAFSPDDGVTFVAPQLSYVASVVAGPNCVSYAVRRPAQPSSDAFIAKLAPDGSTLWATFLGGSDLDAPVALAVDARGNTYVVGNTVSPDFPVTVPRIGVQGTSSVFVTKYTPDGTVAYSAVISGEANNGVNAIALDLSQNVYLLGHTDSQSFPVTPGALVPTLDSGSYDGFLLKLSPNATVVFSTYLDESDTAGAIFVGADDQPIVAGTGPAPGLPPPPQGSSPDFLMKLDPTGSRVVQATYLPGANAFGPTAVGTDALGNLVVLGSNAGTNFPVTPGGYASAPPLSACTSDIYVAKLGASNWNPIYSALLHCGGLSGAMAIDSTGAVVVATGTGAGFPLHDPLVAGPGCPSYSGAVARLSPDGSTLEFSTYIDTCVAPAIALAKDGSIYVGVSNGAPVRGARNGTYSRAGVLHLPSTNPHPMSLDQIQNAFSGDSSAVVGGGLYSLSVSGLQAPTIDLGLNPDRDLPTQLGGVEVTFDGVPAAILLTSPGQVIVVPPWTLPEHASARNDAPAPNQVAEPVFTSVRLSYNGVLSNAAWMPVSSQTPGLLTNGFPVLASSDFPNFADGNVRNQDGTQNDAKHPAAAGSTITVFATGLGVLQPIGAPGSVVSSGVASAVDSPIYSGWAYYTGVPNSLVFPPVIVYTVPGFVSALFQIPIAVPSSLLPLNGTAVGDGVQRVVFGLSPYSPAEEVGPTSAPTSLIGVYLK